METQETIHISDLHFDHKLWMNELRFFEMQLIVFEEKLEEIVTSNSESAVLAKVEAFQNRIIRQKEVIDEIKHKLRLREKDLDKMKNSNSVKKGDLLFTEYESEKDEMNTFIRLYQEMRDDFKAFVAEI
jgi:hypothetical protein